MSSTIDSDDFSEDEYETADETEDYETADEADVEFTTGKLFLNESTIEKVTILEDIEELRGGYDVFDVIGNLISLNLTSDDKYFKFKFVFQYLSMDHPLTLTEKYCKINTLLSDLFKIKNTEDLLDRDTFKIIHEDLSEDPDYTFLTTDNEILRKYNVTLEAIQSFVNEYWGYSYERFDSVLGSITPELIIEHPKFSQVYYECMTLNLQGGKESFKIVIINNNLYEVYYPKSNSRCLLLVLKDYVTNFSSLYKNFERHCNTINFKLMHHLEQIRIIRRLFKIEKEIILHNDIPKTIDTNKINLIHKGKHVGIINPFKLREGLPLQREVKVKPFAKYDNTILATIDFEWKWSVKYKDKTLEEVLEEAFNQDKTLIYAMATKPNLGIVHVYEPGKKDSNGVQLPGKEIIVGSVFDGLQILVNIRRTTKKEFYVYSHNGSLVEHILLLEAIRKLHSNDKEFMLEINNNAGNKIKTFVYNNINFIDSVLFLQSSLDSAIQTYTPGATKYHHPKLYCGACSHKIKCIQCSRLYFTKTWSRYNREDVNYVKQDGKGLMNVLIAFNNLVCLRLNVTNTWTLSKLSLASIAKTKLYELHPWVDTEYFQALMRPFYKGGDCQAHFIGTIKHVSEKLDSDPPNTLHYENGNIISFDIVSMYPSIQSKHLPIKPVLVRGSSNQIFISDLNENKLWCAMVSFKQHLDPNCLCNIFPIVDVYDSQLNKLLNPIITTNRIVQIWSFQYYKFKDCYTIDKIFYAIEFEESLIYTDYVLSNFDRRITIGTKTPEGMNIKLMLNSGTGTLGLKNDRSVKVMSNKECKKYDSLKNKLPRTVTYPVDNFEWLQFKEHKNVKTQLSIISYITAIGRFNINMKKHDIHNEGNIVLQTDTDGIEFLNIKNIEYEDQPNILGGQTIKKYSKLKIDGCKNYTFVKEGEVEERVKCKGKSLSIETWGRDCKTAEINIKVVPKKIKSLYDKGIVLPNGFVKPIIF